MIDQPTAETTIADLQAQLAATEHRLARLEAREAVLATFHQYLYHLDVGYPEELVEAVFTSDAVLEVVNFPPGTMEDHVMTGHDGIAPLYRDHTRSAPAIQGGHHASNVSISVADDLASAHLSAYFMTGFGNFPGVQGGQYQGEAVPDGDRWRFRRYRIISGWGWRVTGDSVRPITDAVPAERAWQGARPAGVSAPR